MRTGAAVRAEQGDEQVVLCARQPLCPARPVHNPSGHVHLDGVQLQHSRQAPLAIPPAPAKYGGDTGSQQAGIDRFRQHIVGAALKQSDTLVV